MKYFRAEDDPKAKLPNNFISGFLEVIIAPNQVSSILFTWLTHPRDAIEQILITIPFCRDSECYAVPNHSPEIAKSR